MKNMQLPYECDVESLDKARDRVLEEGNVQRIGRKASYGRMHGCEASLEYVRSLPESDLREWTLKRMQYEFEKEIPVKAKFHKGIYGKKYDSWSCGHCGKGAIHEVWYKYCPNCGFAIDFEEEKEEEQEAEFEQTSLFEVTE